MSQIKIEIKKTCNFPKDDAMLNGVYSKIVGNAAISLYDILFCEANTELKCDYIETFLSENNITLDVWTENRKSLESIGLISTFYNNESSQWEIYLNRIKSFTDLVSNGKVKSLLLNKIGQEKYAKLEYIFSETTPSNGVEITESIDYLFGNSTCTAVSQTNLDSIIAELSKEYACSVVVSDEVKGILINYFDRNLMPLSKLITIVKNCVSTKDGSSTLYVNMDALTSVLEQSTMSFAGTNAFNWMVRRNDNIFKPGFDKKEAALIKAEYAANPETYLSAITKDNPSFDDRQIINKMKTEGFSHQCINVLIDLTFFRCKGKLTKDYINKAANTIKNMGLSQNLDGIINYLQNNYNVKKSTNVIHKISEPIYVHSEVETKVDDSDDFNSFEEVEWND